MARPNRSGREPNREKPSHRISFSPTEGRLEPLALARGDGPLACGLSQKATKILTAGFFVGVYPGLTEEMLGFIEEVFADFFRAGHRRAV